MNRRDFLRATVATAAAAALPAVPAVPIETQTIAITGEPFLGAEELKRIFTEYYSSHMRAYVELNIVCGEGANECSP